MGAVLLITACSADPADQYSEPVSASSSPTSGNDESSSDDSSNDESANSDSNGNEEPEGDSNEESPEPEEDETSEESAESEESTPSETPEPVSMDASEPTGISIPGIDVQSDMMQLGLDDDGVIEVPPYNAGSPTGWYRHGPTPGEIGPSVILGHRNAIEGGPGIFADLPDMEVGDSIEVTRDDGTTASFTVHRTAQFKQDEFPTLDVYGNTDEAELRLITCDGFNRDTGQLEDNFIVYASLDT